jgi:hypothetical protein
MSQAAVLTLLVIDLKSSQTWGAAADRESGMKWRVMVELIGSDGTVHAHEVNAGGSNTAECSAETVGLTLADGKRTLAGLQDHLV